MIVLRFARYLIPFRRRLALAVFCMGLVSAFGAFNVMMLVPFLRVLLESNGARIESSDAGLAGVVGAMSAGPGADASAESANGPATATESPGDGDSPGPASEPGGAGFLPGFLGGPWRAISGRIDAGREWYRERAAASPMTVLAVLCGALLLMTGAKCGAEYLSNYQLAYVFYFVNVRMREDIYRNILRQDYLFFTRNQPGWLLSRVNSDIRAIQDLIDKALAGGVQQPMTILAMVGVLLWISPGLTLVVALLGPPVGGLLYYFSRVLRKNTRKEKKKADELSGAIAEALFNVRLVKSFGTEGLEIGKFMRRNMQLFRYVMNRRVAKFASSPIMEFLGTCAACGVLILGGRVILGGGVAWIGRLEPAEFITYLATLSRFYRPLRSLSNLALQYQVGRTSAERIDEMLRLAPTIHERPDARPFESLREGIEFRDVGFRFEDRRVLDGVSLSIPRGTTAAVVGRSGSGKTTLANLLPRLFDPTEGAVLFDGVDLRDLRLADVHRRLGIVTQQTGLFDDTVANNIAYGADGLEEADVTEGDPRMERIVEAARAADADEFVRALDGGLGYMTRLGAQGAKLSGGQAQRIAIARAIYRDPAILVLDEATSALDTHAQRQVQRALQRLVRDRTALVIAHRLSTIRDADRIHVLEDGRIVEAGTHDELMRARGAYFALYESETTKGELDPAKGEAEPGAEPAREPRP